MARVARNLWVFYILIYSHGFRFLDCISKLIFSSLRQVFVAQSKSGAVENIRPATTKIFLMCNNFCLCVLLFKTHNTDCGQVMKLLYIIFSLIMWIKPTSLNNQFKETVPLKWKDTVDYYYQLSCHRILDKLFNLSRVYFPLVENRKTELDDP